MRQTLFILLLLCNSLNLFTQKVDLSLQFNSNTTSYEVYARPDFTKEKFVLGKNSQITILVPAEFQNKALDTKSASGGMWKDQFPIFATDKASKSDFHTFVYEGGSIDFQENKPQLLFQFKLPLQYDSKAVRLFSNEMDEELLEKKTGRRFANRIADEEEKANYYGKNYAIKKSIRGTIKDHRGLAFEGVQIKIGTKKTTSLYDGRYEFKNLLIDDAIIFEVNKEIDKQTGLTIADLVALQKHLSGDKPFDKAYQWVAADLDHSGTINLQDLVLLKELLNKEQKSKEGWKFVPKAYLENKTFEKITAEKVHWMTVEREINLDFVAIKMGDIDGSYSIDPKRRVHIIPSEKIITINLLNRKLEAGKKHEITFSSNDFEEIIAGQLAIKVDKASAIFTTFSTLAMLKAKFNKQKNGLITAKWTDEKLGDVKNLKAKQTNGTIEKRHKRSKIVFKLTILPEKDGLVSDFITLVNQPLPAEAYDRNGQKMLIQLLFKAALEEEEALKLYQNQPNPFIEKTSITYFLSTSSPTTLTLSDEAGKILKQYKEAGQKGFNTFIINGENLPKGLIYYKLETEFGTAKKKMLYLK